MAYFPYAYPKLMLATAGILKTANTPTHQVAKAQLAVVDARTNKSVALATATYQTTPKVYLVQGSTHNVDNIGGNSTLGVGAAAPLPFHGGYKESIKSREIDPKHIHRFWYVGPQDQTKAQITVTVTGTPADFEKNQSINGGPHTLNAGTIAQDGDLIRQEVYRLRLDLKGSPVLRYLTHNFTYEFDATTKCMPDGAVDRADLVRQWADAINTHPIIGFGKLVVATAADVVLTIKDNYSETDFSSDPVYTRNDFHEYQGVEIYASVYDERQLTCVPTLFATAGTNVGRQGQGFGDTILNELILEKEYQLDPYHSDTRLRSVLDDSTLSDIDRTKKYGAYFLLYSVPRRFNHTSGLDNDQILIKIVTAPVAFTGGGAGTRDTVFEDFIESYCASAGNPGIVLEDLTGVVK